MTKFTFSRLGSMINAPAAINGVISEIEIALDQLLHRFGTSPNKMQSALDMNGQRIINLPAPVDPNDPLRKADFEDLVLGKILPAGSDGQLQFNNSGVLSGLSISGDATLTKLGALTVTKSNGQSFAASAFSDTTNAGNITTGKLSPLIFPPDGGGEVLMSVGGVVGGYQSVVFNITNGSVATTKIADGAVTAAKLASNAVTTVKILDANVTNAKLASDAVTTVKILDANVTAAKLASDAVTTAKILDANVTQAKLAAGVGTTGPAFRATASGTNTCANATDTKVSLDTKTFDTDTLFNTSTFRFTPNVAGYYQVDGFVFFNAPFAGARAKIFKNGVEYAQGNSGGATTMLSSQVSDIVYLNGSTDYIELYAYQNSGSSQITQAGSRMSAVLIRKG